MRVRRAVGMRIEAREEGRVGREDGLDIVGSGCVDGVMLAESGPKVLVERLD